jgi:putative ABC transport system substrate-binding protein
MRRRDILGLLGGTALWPLMARGQPAKLARIGYLIPAPLDAPVSRGIVASLRQAFAELGYVEGRTLDFELRGAEGRLEQLPGLAAELVAMQVDVIIASSTPAGRAAQRATATIPIVVGAMGDPVGDGLVASLSRPGANVTGTSFLGPELVPKRLALLKELIPSLSRVGVLWHPKAFSDATTATMVQQAADAAAGLGVQLRYVEARALDEFERAFADLAQLRADALFQFPNPTYYENRRRLAELAARDRIPAMWNSPEFVEVGGLIGYGANVVVANRRAAFYVDKILKGARPADLPVELPTVFELAINLKAAKALGLTVPSNMLATADAVIE